MIEDFKKIKGYKYAFHKKVICQHHQFHLINSQHDSKKLLARTGENFKPLNMANLSLGRFCKKMVTELDKNHSVSLDLLETVNEWQDYYNKGGVFDSFSYAKKIITSLESHGFPVFERISKEPGLQNSFINIPYEAKSFFQLKLLVKKTDLMDFMSTLISNAKQKPFMHYYIKEVAINERFVKINTGSFEELFSPIKITFLPGVINSFKNPMISMISEAICDDYSQQIENCEIISKYTFETKPGLYISQGSTNYKNFLKLLNIIDKVYERESNYSFAK